MKVLQIAGSLKLGGQETVVMNIIRNQGRYCHHDVVIFDHYHGGYYPEALKYSSNIYELTSPTKNIFKFFLKFKRILKSTKYDIIHCHTYSSTGLVIILTKMLDRQVKFITHIHTDGSNNNNSLLKNCYVMIMNKLIIKYSDKIITISEKTNQRYLSSNKSCIIENGIITKRYSYNEEIRKNIRKILHIDRDDIVLGHVGRFVPEKNQKFLLKVLVKLLEVNSRYKLLLIGDGDTYKNELIKMINDANLLNNVIIVSNIHNVNEYLSAMDIFLFPSLFEGMPLSLIEAQVNRLPVFASAAINREIDKTNTIRFLEIDDVEPWVRNIISVPHHQRTKISDYSIYDLSRQINNIYSLYQGLMEE